MLLDLGRKISIQTDSSISRSDRRTALINSLTNTATPPPFLTNLSLLKSVKPGNDTSASEMLLLSHVSVKAMMWIRGLCVMKTRSSFNFFLNLLMFWWINLRPRNFKVASDVAGTAKLSFKLPSNCCSADDGTEQKWQVEPDSKFASRHFKWKRDLHKTHKPKAWFLLTVLRHRGQDILVEGPGFTEISLHWISKLARRTDLASLTSWTLATGVGENPKWRPLEVFFLTGCFGPAKEESSFLSNSQPRAIGF